MNLTRQGEFDLCPYPRRLETLPVIKHSKVAAIWNMSKRGREPSVASWRYAFSKLATSNEFESPNRGYLGNIGLMEDDYGLALHRPD